MLLRGKHFGNLEELEEEAKPLIPAPAYYYYVSGADSEHSLRDNRAAFSRYRLLPRALRDVSAVDTACEILGEHPPERMQATVSVWHTN